MEDCASHISMKAPVWPIVGSFATEGLDMVNGVNVVPQIHLHEGTKERRRARSYRMCERSRGLVLPN